MGAVRRSVVALAGVRRVVRGVWPPQRLGLLLRLAGVHGLPLVGAGVGLPLPRLPFVGQVELLGIESEGVRARGAHCVHPSPKGVGLAGFVQTACRRRVEAHMLLFGEGTCLVWHIDALES